MDSVVPRSADPDQSMEQRGALGTAHAAVSAHAGILLAGGTHGARDRRRSGSRNAPDARHLYGFRGARSGRAGHSGAQIRGGALCGRRPDVLDRSDDGRSQSIAGGDVAQPRPEFRESVRDSLPRQGRRPAALLDDLVGTFHEIRGRHHHGSRRRSGSDPAAAPGAVSAGDRADLQDGRRASRRARKCAAPAPRAG